MPFLVPMFAAIAAWYGGLAVGAQLMIQIGLSVGISLLSRLLTPSASLTSQNGEVGIAQPILPRKVVYGTRQVTGDLTFAAVEYQADNTQYLHLVFTLADHEIGQFLWVHTESSYSGTTLAEHVAYSYGYTWGFAGSSDFAFNATTGYWEVTSGYFWGGAPLFTWLGVPEYSFVGFEIDRGDPSNTAEPFPQLAAANVGWGTTDLQRGCAKVHVRLRYDKSVADGNNNYPFIGGRIPKFQFGLAGKLVRDTRVPFDGSWRAHTPFPRYDYLIANGRIYVQKNLGTYVVPISGASGPTLSATVGSTTSDGGCSWENHGTMQSAWPGANHNFPDGTPNYYVFIDPNGNLQALITHGPTHTGTAEPEYSKVRGDQTIDGSARWLCLGPPPAFYCVPATSGSSTTLANAPDWIYGNNSALVAYDYATWKGWGFSIDPATFDLDSVNAAANLCDVQRLGSPAISMAYTSDGLFESTANRGTVLQHLLAAMAGWLIPPGDSFRLFAGAPLSAVWSITDSDLRDGIKMDTRVAFRDLANGVRGRFTPNYLPVVDNQLAPAYWNETDFPPYQGNGQNGHPDFITEDGQVLWKDMEYPFTTNLFTCQRLAKIELMRMRRPRTLVLPCKLTVFPISAGDVVQFAHARWGWTDPPPAWDPQHGIYNTGDRVTYNQKRYICIADGTAAFHVPDTIGSPYWTLDSVQPKLFQVTQLLLIQDSKQKSAPYIGVDLTVREYDSSIYAFTEPGGAGGTYGEYDPYGWTGMLGGNVE